MEEKKIQIKAKDETLQGKYANVLQVQHSKEEFVLDFMNIYPWQKMGVVTARVITGPGHMKRIYKALCFPNCDGHRRIR
jgi:hypothetical protein